MPFDLETWKQRTADSLKLLENWLERRKNKEVPYLIYGTLCSLSLWPLVEAAQAGQLWPAAMALGGVAGGLGGNLLAAQIQAWKENADRLEMLEKNNTALANKQDAETVGTDSLPLILDEMVHWVTEQAPLNPALREALDAILEKMEAISQAQAGLQAGAERQWLVETLRAELAQLGNLARFEMILVNTVAEGPGALAVMAAAEDSIAIGTIGGDVVGEDKFQGQQVIVVKDNATVIFGQAPQVTMTAVERESALGRYLQHIISRNRYLQLQGIRSGGRLVHIELDRIYITLHAIRPSPVPSGKYPVDETKIEMTEMRVNEALDGSRRLVVLGDPGSGKTTLLRYLALLYARDLAEGTNLVREKLDLPETGYLPVLLPMRQLGAFLRHQLNDGTEGHALLLAFLRKSLTNERIQLPDDFFDEVLNQGKAVILLDGLDEVADSELRWRVARLVESFSRAYPACRYVVTSRMVGYAGPARLGDGYTTTTVREFSLADVAQFLMNWHRLVAIGHMGPGPSAEAYAAGQTQQLLEAIRGNERIQELAINPLLLTVIAMVHRDRVKLPDRRAELYAEAVDVLLGKWEEAKEGITEISILSDKPFDTGDKRLMLQNLALYMQEKEQKELAVAELRQWLGQRFFELAGNWREVARTVDRFLAVIEGRTGLLAARGEGVYAFSHLTFQEYLAARQKAKKVTRWSM